MNWITDGNEVIAKVQIRLIECKCRIYYTKCNENTRQEVFHSDRLKKKN